MLAVRKETIFCSYWLITLEMILVSGGEGTYGSICSCRYCSQQAPQTWSVWEL